jgi:histidine phosphotransferase ChpT
VSASETFLAELLCARICHDLSGPVGAVAAGAELMAEDGTDQESMDLLAASAKASIARLKFLRVAFGPGTALDAQKLRELIASFLATRNPAGGEGGVDLVWPESWSLPGSFTRLVANMVLLAQDCVPRGGLIRIGSEHPELMLAEGAKAALHDEAAAILQGGADPSTPRGAQAWFVRREANALGYDIKISCMADRVQLGLKLA